MVLSSEDCKATYPGNKPYDFLVHLSSPISLSGYWSVSMLEFSIGRGKTKYPTEELFVFSNLCDNTILAGREVPLLRRVWFDDNKQNVIYELPYDVPLRIGQFQEVHIYIKDSSGSPASFILDRVTVALRLKKHPFLH